MTDDPAPKSDFQAKEYCQDDQPAILWIAGLLLLLFPIVVFSDNHEQPRCQSVGNTGFEMVVIPAGSYQMGSPVSEDGRFDDEGPVRPVEIDSFALAVCEVTVAEFRRFVEATGYQTDAESIGSGCWHNSERGNDDWKLRPGFQWRNALHGDSNEDHPVVCVSWNDANRYATWFSEITNAPYRLPTEAEWEYAARAGIKEPRYYAGREQCLYANGFDQTANEEYDFPVKADCRDEFVHTAPVGHFAPNAWGLHDMLGNVWEWTQDCWHKTYDNAPIDGSSWEEVDGVGCNQRVLRGGSWFYEPENLRSALRNWLNTDNANGFLGFRLARTISPSEL